MAGTRGKHSAEYVDISSNTQVTKVYKKKGRVKRVLALILAILCMVSGGGLIYYYNALDSMNFILADLCLWYSKSRIEVKKTMC